MSRSKKGGKGPGHEYWSKRPFSGVNPGKENKKITHRIERARSKQKLKKKEPE
jgi:hypothetical protein